MIATDPLAGAGLAAMLQDQPGCAVVGQVPAESDLLATLDTFQCDIVLWDLGWDPVSALEQLADLADTIPPVVALLPDETHGPEAWTSGARGLLLRNVDGPQLAAALTAASRGLTVLDPKLITSVQPSLDRSPNQVMGDLTPREHEVLRLLADGMPNKSIADRLNISEHTVKFHVNAILGKLGAQSRTEAVTRAMRLGLILL